MANEIFKIQFPGWYYLQAGAFLNPMLSFPLSVLAGIGFVEAYGFLKKRLQSSSRKPMKIKRHFVLGTLLLLIVILVPTIAVWNLGINFDLRRFQMDRISTADYNAMMWVANNTPEDAVIFNDQWVGTASTWIPLISHRHIIMPLLSISEVGWTDTMITRQEESYRVTRDPHSTEALSILKKYNVSYIYISNQYSAQVEEWRDNYDAQFFLQGPHYELAFNEDNAWVIRVVY